MQVLIDRLGRGFGHGLQVPTGCWPGKDWAPLQVRLPVWDTSVDNLQIRDRGADDLTVVQLVFSEYLCLGLAVPIAQLPARYYANRDHVIDFSTPRVR